MTSATTPIAETTDSSADTITTDVPDESTSIKPVRKVKSVRWRDNQAEEAGPGEGMLVCRDECQEFDVSEEEREWKRSGQVKRWKVKLRLIRMDLKNMMKASVSGFTKDVRTNMQRQGGQMEIGAEGRQQDDSEKGESNGARARVMEDRARQEE
ncbi:hypothetical protein FKW77_005086 [Venturia effusa]|uniref:Uncharacterized protein n=1 Tax=Venturia effusa TaxID=50376 RepID=A0A517KWC2_9PEZI|nr:hypothetical protein FKW77_005086 [Venturia effusa]